MKGPNRRATTTMLVGAVLASVGGSGALIWHASYSAFSATTANPNDQWSSGSVAITDDHQPSTAMFAVSGAHPDASATSLSAPATGPFNPGADNGASGGSACIKVTYTGTITANNIRMYASSVTGNLPYALLVTVDAGTDTATGTDNGCATYTATAVGNVYAGTAANSAYYLLSPNQAGGNSFPATYAASASSVWTNAAQNATKWYRVSWLIPFGQGNTTTVSNATSTSVASEQTANATVTFTWEVDNT